MRISIFDSIYTFQCTLNVLLECIELFNTAQFILYGPIVLLESIDMILAYYASIIYSPILLCFKLRWHI